MLDFCAMEPVLYLRWWMLAIRGVAGVLFGVIALMLPGITLAALTLLFGVYAFIDGIVSLAAAFGAGKDHRTWWSFLLEGIAGLMAAIATFTWPALTLLFLLYLIAGWAIVTGVFEIIAAVELRRVIRREWLLALAGIASIAFGVLLFSAPGAGAFVIAWWIGAYALLFGLLLLSLSFRVRHLSQISAHPAV
jgi:uncharacterized membrane protein HdeD (DUF308 family)